MESKKHLVKMAWGIITSPSINTRHNPQHVARPGKGEIVIGILISLAVHSFSIILLDSIQFLVVNKLPIEDYPNYPPIIVG